MCIRDRNCTIKKKDNCGAYLYNSKTGSTYFCNSTKCTEILEALEVSDADEVKGSTETKKSKKSKIPKFGKKKKRNLKFRNLRRKQIN